MIFSESFVTDLFGIALSLFVVFISYFKWSHSYWKRKNLPHLEPTIPFGNLLNPMNTYESIGITIKRRYKEMKSNGWQHGGIYMMATPTYVAIDLEYVKNILTKDFKHFVDRSTYYNEKDDPIGAHLFTIGCTKWRNLRMKLNPTFTSGKMKMMFQTLADCQANLQDKIKSEYNKKKPIDIKEILGCFTTNIIGSCAFGLECNTFKDNDSPFRRYGRKVFAASTLRRIQISFFKNFPKLARALKMRRIPKDISDFFTKVVTDTVNYRELNN